MYSNGVPVAPGSQPKGQAQIQSLAASYGLQTQPQITPINNGDAELEVFLSSGDSQPPIPNLLPSGTIPTP